MRGIAANQGVRQEQGKDNRADKVERRWSASAASVDFCKRRGKPRFWQQVVNAQAERKRATHDGKLVKQERAAPHDFADDQKRGYVYRRSRHEQHERRAWGKSLEHERHGNGDGTRSAEVHGDGAGQDEEHAQQGGVGKQCKEGVGHEDRDESRYQ